LRPVRRAVGRIGREVRTANRSRSPKVKSLKSRRLDTDQASQIKSGLLPMVSVAYKSPALKWDGAVNKVAYKYGL
jgi:hypothetical protein